ncbi:hypothetical protein CEXT_186891 [Caerostris extrusa]|uniref:Uncharacterized protein n=1 Tax=Caerostris extrusa TaxID=172846 RepID=A0AAV4X4W7_CAEEX|nr:hypothetical protein CEXT_186891 [Caerostris extrusa]
MPQELKPAAALSISSRCLTINKLSRIESNRRVGLDPSKVHQTGSLPPCCWSLVQLLRLGEELRSCLSRTLLGSLATGISFVSLLCNRKVKWYKSINSK